MTLTPRPDRQPILNIPPVTGILLLVNVAIDGLRLLMPEDAYDQAIVSRFAFIPARYTGGAPFGWPALVDPITYQFLHGSLTHLAINMVALLAFGSGVERRIGGARMLALALLCGIAAAALHLAVYPGSDDPVVGASGAISGLFGAVLRLLMRNRGGSLLPLVALWIVMDVVSGQMGAPGDSGASIAWVAHIGGFLAGLGLIGLFERGRPEAGLPPH